MHIPDGYLGPKTYTLCWLLVAPFWARGWHYLRQRMQSLEVPHIALAAAFVFVLMMFNIPVPGGTTGHAVGASIVAIALGAWPAVLAVSLALLIQALFFGDGGITAIGANCLNIAVVHSFVSLAVWNLLRPRELALHRRRTMLAAFASGYLGLLAAAFTTSVEFGLQPLLEHTPEGTPLYSALPLSVTVPAMVVSHLLLGIAEGAVTALVVGALARRPQMLGFASSNLLPAEPLWRRKCFWGWSALVALLLPLGLWIPRLFGAGEAFGEWSPQEAAARANLSSVPHGMSRLAELWSAPFADYSLGGASGAGAEALHYILSALIGVVLTVFVAFWLGRLVRARHSAVMPPVGE